MKVSSIARPAAILAGLMVVAAGLVAGGEPTAKTSKPNLEQGMSAAEVRAIVGDPVEIKSMESKEAKAEQWIYRRKVRTETTQEAVSFEEQPAFIGLGVGNENGLGTVSVPVYRLKYTTFYQITALLMVNDTLIMARQWMEQNVSYES